MSSKSWSQRFGLSDFEVRDLSKAAGDPLRGALLSGRVPESEYLEWAMAAYELPRVKSEFFRIPVDPVFYEAVKSEYKWNASFVPLAEWNGVLLIGCLEPPNFHFRTKYTARFVLASAQELFARFQQLEPGATPAFAPPPQILKPVFTEPSTVSVPTPSPKKPSAPVDAPISKPQPIVPPPPKVVAKSEPSLEELLAKPAIDLPEAPDVSLDEPDGLVEVPKQASDERMFVPDGVSESAVDLSKDQFTAKTAPPTESPDGLKEGTFVTAMRVDFGALTVSSSDVKKDDPPRRSQDEEEITNTNVPIDVPPPPMRSKDDVPPVARPQAIGQVETQPSITQPIQTTNVTIAPYPPTVPKPPTQPADLKMVASQSSTSVVSNNVDIVPFNECKTYDQLAGSTLGRVLRSFDVGMVLTFQNGQLVPWKWTELMNSVKGDTPDPIDLAGASFFRIVFRTCLPYHGYVVASPVNTAFFNAFTRGLPPKHATIMPVLISRKVAGMILGFSSKEVDFRRTLGEMEIIAAEFGTHLDRIKGSQKKAA